MRSETDSGSPERGSPDSFFRFRLGATGLLVAAGTVAAALSVVGFTGRFWWVLELTSHFRVQYLVGLATIALALGLLRRRRAAIVFVLFAILNLVPVLPLYMGGSSETTPEGRAFRGMLINVHTANRNDAAVREAITRHDPDFVVVLETDAWWLEQLAGLSRSYPHSVARPRDDNFGIAFFSRLPVESVEIVGVRKARLPAVLARYEIAGKEFTVLGAHLPPPVNARHANWRNEYLEMLPGMLEELTRPVLLLGDLNATPRSFHFRQLLRDVGLINGSRGHGLNPTWPAGQFHMLIPIDHCLHSPGIRVTDLDTGSSTGSDHYPLIVDFTVDETNPETRSPS